MYSNHIIIILLLYYLLNYLKKNLIINILKNKQINFSKNLFC